VNLTACGHVVMNQRTTN